MNRQINHKVMRIVIGVIAILLAPVVLLLAGQLQGDLTSISGSYWTDSQDVFVGSLFAVGFFLAAYNGVGTGRDWEYFLSKAACVFAIGVALFPTTKIPVAPDVVPEWIGQIAQALGVGTQVIHYTSAILLFGCLIAMIWFFSNRAARKGRPGRALTYRAIAIAMVVGIVAIFVIGNWVFGYDRTALLLEAWALTLFGTGWLIAGVYPTNTGSGIEGGASSTSP